MKTNLLLPIAGDGQRFLNQGYFKPKPLISINGKAIVDRSLESVVLDNCNLIFVVRQEHIDKDKIDKHLKEQYPDCKIIATPTKTDGALNTCLLAEDLINNHVPLLIFTPDCYFEPAIDPLKIDLKLDGMVCVFESNSPAHSFVTLNEEGYVNATAEKEVISNMAIGGLYYFKRGDLFVENARNMIKWDMRTKGEFYIAPIYNLLITQGKKIGIDKNTRHDILGTPEDLEKHSE